MRCPSLGNEDTAAMDPAARPERPRSVGDNPPHNVKQMRPARWRVVNSCVDDATGNGSTDEDQRIVGVHDDDHVSVDSRLVRVHGSDRCARATSAPLASIAGLDPGGGPVAGR
jgi:hypothetical protein